MINFDGVEEKIFDFQIIPRDTNCHARKMNIIIESIHGIDMNSFAQIGLNGEIPYIYFDLEKVKKVIRGTINVNATVLLMYEGLSKESASKKSIDFNFIYHEC